MAVEYLSGPPATVKHFKTTYSQKINGAAAYRDNEIYNTGDNGVFVCSTSWVPSNDKPPTDGYYTRLVNKSTKCIPSGDSNTVSCLGGKINMDTANETYTIVMYGTQYSTWSNNTNIRVHDYGVRIYRGSITEGTNVIPFLCDNGSDNRTGILVSMPDEVADHVNGTVEKTEFAWSKTRPNSIGISGFTMYSAKGPAGGIRLPDSTGPFNKFGVYGSKNNDATKSLIMCRIVPTDHEGLTYDADKITNNFVVFDGLCDFVLGSSGDTSAIGEPVVALVPSLTKSQVASNTGMLAVAVMAKGTTKAYYIGNKNSVYKLYNGPDPYIMPPGSIVNIGKKQFQSIAYSSYYVKLN